MSDRGYWPPGTRVRVRTSEATWAPGTVEHVVNGCHDVRLDNGQLYRAAPAHDVMPEPAVPADRLHRWLLRGHAEGEITVNDVRDALRLPEVPPSEDAHLQARIVAAALAWANASRQSPAVELAARARLFEAAETLEVHRS